MTAIITFLEDENPMSYFQVTMHSLNDSRPEFDPHHRDVKVDSANSTPFS